MAKRSIKRNSRAIALLACIALAVALLPAAAFADDGTTTDMPLATTTPDGAATVASGTCGPNLTWVLDDDGTLIISYAGSGTGEMNDYYNESDVPWYGNKNEVKTVVIGSGVTKIGENAFYGCAFLENVTIPSGVKSIGVDAFAVCTSLNSVVIPSGVISIQVSAFAGCSSLNYVVIPSSVNSIEGNAFGGCKELKDVYFVGVKQIWNGIDIEEDWTSNNPKPVIHYMFSVTAAVNPAGGGEVAFEGNGVKVEGGMIFERGETRTCLVTAKPNKGYAFVSWTGSDISNPIGDNPYGFVYSTPQIDSTLTANFKHPLTITAKDQTYTYDGKTQGEGDTAYADADAIAEKFKVEGLQGKDELTSIILDGQGGPSVGTYEGVLHPSNAVIKNEDGNDVTGNYAIEYVNGTLTITDAVTYTVKFVNYDGTVLQSGKIAYGEMPKYEGATPTRPETAEYTYAFKGWEPALAKVTGDATYKATYTETAKKGVYEVVSGAGGTWTEGSGEPLTFTFKRTVNDGTAFDHFTGILVDGKAVSQKDSSGNANWTARRGSVVVALQPSYLATLPAGAHTITATFDDGNDVDAAFTLAPATHTVTFDANGHGKAPDAQEVEHGKKAKRPASPTADGYTFGGWYTDKACKEAYDFSKPVTEDVTLYAKWTKKSSSGSGTSPKTGDPLAGAFTIALTLAAVSGLVVVVSRRRRRG